MTSNTAINWDYSDRAATYEHRADYDSKAMDRLLRHIPHPHLARERKRVHDHGRKPASRQAAKKIVFRRDRKGPRQTAQRDSVKQSLSTLTSAETAKWMLVNNKGDKSNN